jgi:NADPH:quinone reductase
MAQAIRFHQIGGPEVLRLEAVDAGEPGPGQARVRHTYIAVNFIDIYFRTGRYPLALPNGLGSDAVGVVEAIGPGVTDVKPGDRVGYLLGPQGAYSDVRVMPADVLIPLPDGVSDATASTLMMKGMTAQYLFRQVYPLKGGETILYHAAAGGVGLIACQWAKALGLKLIGTAGSEEKCALARDNGAAFTINYRTEDFAARVKEITGGKGVKIVYDSIGKDTWDKSLECLRPFGLMASFGNASGVVPPFAPVSLGPKGSLYVTRQTLMTHIATRERMQAMADDLFQIVESGQVKIHIAQRYPLADAAQAHRDLEARKTTGSTILIP